MSGKGKGLYKDETNDPVVANGLENMWFVSHNLNDIESYCFRALALNEGNGCTVEEGYTFILPLPLLINTDDIEEHHNA